MRLKKICAAICGPLFLIATLATPAVSSAVAASGLFETSASALASSITVRAGEDLQAALNRAAPGDTILLEAGATFTGNFVLPVKSDANDQNWITIRSSAADADLPAPGVRAHPAMSHLFPKLVSPNADAALKTATGAHHYRLMGIELAIGEDVKINFGIVKLGEGSEAEASMLPRDIELDRCYIHGHKTADLSRGVALNGANTSVLNSYIAECHGIGFDTQAIAGWNGPGPFKIVNNYLEAAGENVLFGGADPKIQGLVPSDIEFLHNHCSKPVAWQEGILSRPSGITARGLAPSDGSFPAGSLPTGVTHYYRVAARARAGQSVTATSVASDEIGVTLAQPETAVELTWAPAELAKQYRIYRTADDPTAASRKWVYFDVDASGCATADGTCPFVDTGAVTIAGEGAPPERATRWTVKNIFELKNARRVLVDGNLFENNWVDGQNGTAILFTVRNQQGTAPWSVVEDVTFTNNIVRHTAAAINILGRDNNHPSEQVKRLKVRNNLFVDVSGRAWGGGNGTFLTITESLDVTVDQNTIIHAGNLITAYGVANVDFFYINNLAAHNDYGIIGDGTGSGLPTLDRYFPSITFKKNVIAGAVSARYPDKKNFYPSSLDAVGFLDKENGNYRLNESSLYKNLSTRNKDIGADIDAIERATGQPIGRAGQ
ncbi:MAG TPA: hypothetical protein VNH22_06685 [Blastocatellia bacterium]|jgi:hypothetical protein|nr:hypothetical protein [Blastocatellia bacterium]